MSQAIIDFCEGLKSALLGVEAKLAKAQESIKVNAAQAGGEAKKHIDEAAEQLQAFKVHAGLMAQAIRADLPEQKAAMQEKLKDFGLEAQVAMRHAAVFLAEAASAGADTAAAALKKSAESARDVAENLRRDTAVVVQPPNVTPPDKTDTPDAAA
jgi:hypothetical protein